MSIIDFITAIGAFLAFFLAGWQAGYALGYRIGCFDQRQKDKEQKK